VRAPPMCR